MLYGARGTGNLLFVEKKGRIHVSVPVLGHFDVWVGAGTVATFLGLRDIRGRAVLGCCGVFFPVRDRLVRRGFMMRMGYSASFAWAWAWRKSVGWVCCA